MEAAGLETPYNDMNNKLQRRHFTGKTSSNISSNEKYSENVDISNEQKEMESLQRSEENKAVFIDMNKLQRRHFSGKTGSDISTNEKYSENVDISNEQKEVESLQKSEENKAMFNDMNKLQRRHFPGTTSSDISTNEKYSEDVDISNEQEKMESRQKSEENKTNQAVCISSAGLETPDNDMNKLQRKHFPGKTSSDISTNEKYSENVDTSNEQERMESPQKSEENEADQAVFTSSAGMVTPHNDMNYRSQKKHFLGKTSSNIFNN